MRYLLDTATLVDFAKGWEPVYSRIIAWDARGDELGVTPINIAEFYAGLAISERTIWDSVFASLAFWPVSLGAARQAGVWRYEFLRRGISLSTPDTLVAAVALEQGAIVVTSNVRHYPMSGIQLLNPRL